MSIVSEVFRLLGRNRKDAEFAAAVFRADCALLAFSLATGRDVKHDFAVTDALRQALKSSASRTSLEQVASRRPSRVFEDERKLVLCFASVNPEYDRHAYDQYAEGVYLAARHELRTRKESPAPKNA